MHYLVIATAIVLVVTGWWGIYDANVHGTGSGSISYAGTFLGLSNMIAGIGLGIFGRIVQAGHHQRQLLDAIHAAMPATLQAQTPTAAPEVENKPAPSLSAGDETRSTLSSEIPALEAQGWEVVSVTGTVARLIRRHPA